METGYWLKASGACKEMSKVQPKHIQLVPRRTDTLCWLVRHWSQAKELNLDLSSLPVGDPHQTSRYDRKTYWEDPEVASWEARDVKIEWQAY
ncbi:hypothetical protein COCOBI_02-0390 [Coccomyxa sp. Obi]|nr:hypothetical protein COCOBI_02-0390 [Coccomyxa sp. Obi]